MLPAAARDARAERALRVLLLAALAVSVVHYADNYASFADYPEPVSGPAPSRTLIGLSWFGFTAAGLAGYVLIRRGRARIAAGLLAVYAGSGLVGIGHYTVPGALGMPWWRHAHVLADIACGLAILAFAARTARAPRLPPDPARA